MSAQVLKMGTKTFSFQISHPCTPRSTQVELLASGQQAGGEQGRASLRPPAASSQPHCWVPRLRKAGRMENAEPAGLIQRW